MLVTKKAPDFTAAAVLATNEIDESFNLYHQLKHSTNGIILFFWPKDFTFVCPSAIIASDNTSEEFESRGY